MVEEAHEIEVINKMYVISPDDPYTCWKKQWNVDNYHFFF